VDAFTAGFVSAQITAQPVFTQSSPESFLHRHMNRRSGHPVADMGSVLGGQGI
jgi:hypothetical protein